ncbi:hypothetical protein [Bdellovibrio bacteriovorus]|nr:hypothetical protein [Bdellovibrio bacteriovorus]
MNYMGRISGLILALVFSATAHAALPSKKKIAAKPQPVSKILAGEGASFGGLAGSGFTLLDVRRTADAKKKIERLVLDVGDIQGAPMKGWPGYYYAELKKNPQRLVIDFSQMPNARINQQQIKQRLQGSMAVRNSQMSLDPVDNSLNLTLDLKQNTKVRVYQVAGKKSTSKVVVDLITE